MYQKVNVNNNGLGFFGLLTIVFVIAKLFNYVDWSWWLVFAPIWIPAVVVLSIILLPLIAIVILQAIAHFQRKRDRKAKKAAAEKK